MRTLRAALAGGLLVIGVIGCADLVGLGVGAPDVAVISVGGGGAGGANSAGGGGSGGAAAGLGGGGAGGG